MTHDGSSPRAPLGQRARDELARAQELQLTGARAVAAGAVMALGAIVLKALANQVAGGETGYILLVAAAILASWFGGVLAGLTATLVTFLVNSVLFVDAYGDPLGGDPVSLARQALFVVTGIAASVLLASRRSSRDRLAARSRRCPPWPRRWRHGISASSSCWRPRARASGSGTSRPAGSTWSEAIFEQHGLDPAVAAPDFETYLGMIHEDDRERFTSAIEAAIAGGGRLRHRVPPGLARWQRALDPWRRTVFRDSAGRPIRMIGTGQDITDRALEEERDRLLAEERRAGEFREAFVDVISHELRTPITTILGTTEILSRPDAWTTRTCVPPLLADVRAESERLYRLVEDLLVLSRVERGRLVVERSPSSRAGSWSASSPG